MERGVVEVHISSHPSTHFKLAFFTGDVFV